MSDEYYSAPSEPGVIGGTPPVWELSGWWRRVGATVIDYFLVWIPISVVLSLMGVSEDATTTGGSVPSELDGVGWLAVLVASSVYFMLTMSAWNGQTVGKRVTGIRVVRESGEPVDAKFAFVRQTLVIAILFDALAVMLLFIPTVLNYLWPLWDEKHQALHDKIVKSRVVRAYPVSDPGSFQIAQQEQPPATPAPLFPTGAVPPPPTPGGPSTPYTPPPGFENPVPDDD